MAANSLDSGAGGGALVATGRSNEMTAQGGSEDGSESPDTMMERLVDAVVDRLEQRVIEELERRGRRQSWTAF